MAGPEPDDVSRVTRRGLLGGAIATTGLAAVGALDLGPSARRASALTPADTTLTLDLTATSGRVGPRALGFSFERSTLALPLFEAGNADLVALFRLLGPGVLRLGGNSVDRTPWDPTGLGRTAGRVAPPDLARLRGFADAVDWQVLYGTPFVLPGVSAASVASEVAVVADALGPRLDGIELCNEPDLYVLDAAHAALAGTWSLFLARWEGFAAAVRSAVPGVALTGPAACLLTSIGGWTSPFAAAEAGGVSALTQHYYRGFGIGPQTIDVLLAPDPLLASSLPTLAERAVAAGAPGGFRIGETNSFANGGQPGVSNTFASALWAVGHHLRCLAGGATGLNFHNSGAGQGYPAIVQVGGTVTQIRPLFHGLLLASRLGTGPLLEVVATPGTAALQVHALRAATDVVRLVVVNTDAATPADVSVDAGATLVSASVERLLGPALDALTGTTFGGAAVGTDGTWTPDAPVPLVVAGRSTTVAVPAASAAVIELVLAPTPTTTDPPPTTTTTIAPVTTTPPQVPATAPAAQPATPLPASPAYVG